MNAPSIDILTPQDALFMADSLLADARCSEDAYLQLQLCSLVDRVFLRVGRGLMDQLRSSTSAEDQEIIHRVDDIYAERDDVLALLGALALSCQSTDGKNAKASQQCLASLNSALLRLKSQVLGEQDLGLYVPLMAKARLQARDEALFSLMDKAPEFLESDGQVMLLLGDSGAGKTTFNHQLELQLWRSYKVDMPIPLYINLPTIDEPEHDIVAKQLHRHNLSADQIRELRNRHRFTLICDGYDECQQLPNLYLSNQLNMPGQWRAKVFISCRSEYIGSDYRGRFQPPVSDTLQPAVSLFQEAVIAPFSTDQILLYIDQYVISSSNPQGTPQEYVDKLNGIPGLMELVQNPFLLTLALESLPKVVGNNEQDLDKAQISRVTLYDKFIEQWLEIGKQRLQESPLTPQEHTLFYRLLDDGVYEQR
ncbi:Transducin (beta)-like 1 X-linked receptor 1, partial [Mortierella sp. 14UC]